MLNDNGYPLAGIRECPRFPTQCHGLRSIPEPEGVGAVQNGRFDKCNL